MTSYLLYSLAQTGFKIDILQFGMNVIMDTLNLAVELASEQAGEDIIDLDEPFNAEG